MYLGIDLGTSAIKACIMDDNGQVVATTSTALPIQHPFEGASEQNCADWWAATLDAVGRIDAATRAKVRAIGLSGQMHGAVLLDADRTPLRPAILWNDARASTECAQMMQAEPETSEISGVLAMPGFTAPKVLWLARHEPAIHAKIRHILLPKDYIGLMLHGNLVSDPSDAAGTSWFDQAGRCWSPRLCEISQTDPDWLPEVRAGTQSAGPLTRTAADLLGLTPGIPVAAGAGDGAAGAVGIGAVADGDGFVSMGTSGQLFVTTGTYRPRPESRIHAYAHTMPDTWFQMAAMLNGARPMAWLAALLDRPIEALLHEAEAAAPGPVFLPYLMGERTPHGDSDIRGGFALLGENTSQGSLMRAVVEAVAFSFADAFEALAGAGTRPTRVLSIGGGTRSDFLMQTIATVTGCELGRSAGADIGPALGAARLAAACCHDAPISDWAPRPEVDRWFAPDPQAQEALARRLVGYRALYPALKQMQDAMAAG